jgi:hypothetical protein
LHDKERQKPNHSGQPCSGNKTSRPSRKEDCEPNGSESADECDEEATPGSLKEGLLSLTGQAARITPRPILDEAEVDGEIVQDVPKGHSTSIAGSGGWQPSASHS